MAEHVAWEVGQKWSQKILNWRPSENPRKRDRPALRWSDELNEEFGSRGQRVAQDRRRWRTSVEEYARKWVKVLRPSSAAPGIRC